MDKKTLDIILAVLFIVNVLGVAAHYQTGDGGLLIAWLCAFLMQLQIIRSRSIGDTYAN